MDRFFNKRQKLLRNLLPVSTLFLFLMISGLFPHPNSFNPASSTDELINKRLKVHQASAVAIKNASDVHLNLKKVTRWGDEAIHETESNLLGNEHLARLEGVNEIIKKAVTEEWPTPEEKGLFEVVLNDLENYRKSCILTIRMAPSNLQRAALFSAADDHFRKLDTNLRDLYDLETRLSSVILHHPQKSVSTPSGSLRRNDESGPRSIPRDNWMSRQVSHQSWE
jgi:hypothetical protein